MQRKTNIPTKEEVLADVEPLAARLAQRRADVVMLGISGTTVRGRWVGRVFFCVSLARPLVVRDALAQFNMCDFPNVFLLIIVSDRASLRWPPRCRTTSVASAAL